MQKNPIVQEPPIDETPRKKTGRRKKRETACEDKRRAYGTCSICGSEDVACEILAYCTVCGAEEFTVTQRDWPWKLEAAVSPSCGCTKTQGKYVYSAIQYNVCEVCLACGSMKANTCPSCRGEKYFGAVCWTSPFGEKRCDCGFRHPGYRVE